MATALPRDRNFTRAVNRIAWQCSVNVDIGFGVASK
jgi:hypothetical protein